MDFDRTEEMFQKHTVDHKEDIKPTDYAIKLVEGFDDEADADQLLQAAEIVKKLSSPNRIDEVEIDSFKPIPHNFPVQLTNLLKPIEAFFSARGIKSFAALTDETPVQYYKLKVSKDMKKATFHYAYEEPNKKVIVVYLQNLHETWGNSLNFYP